MKQLVANQACGIIATHDLALGELEKEFPNQIKNYRFEADIQDNELTFSYQLREGIAQKYECLLLDEEDGDNGITPAYTEEILWPTLIIQDKDNDKTCHQNRQ